MKNARTNNIAEKVSFSTRNLFELTAADFIALGKINRMLIRDAGMLVHEAAYVLKMTGVMNIFTHTSHVESMAVFERADSALNQDKIQYW